MTENQQYLDCAIDGCEKISDSIYLVTLEAPEDISFKFLPGQYLFIHMSDDDARPFSIASTPASDRKLQMHIQDIPGNEFTGQVLHKLKNESHINVRIAAGKCTIDRSDGNRPLLFIAGGTGFAPCHSIIQSLIESDDSRSISLYWGANSSKEFYLRDKPEQWMKDQSNFTFIPVINDANEDWSGEKGMVHEAVFRHIDRLDDYDIYLSGSSPMVINVYRQLRDKKVPSTQIYSDMLDILREKGELDAD